MKHPDQESLAALLYGEGATEERAEIENHLRECAQCRAHLEQWHAVRRELAGWRLPAATFASAEQRPRAVRRLALPVLRWAVAAMVFAALGFGVARLTPRPPVDTAALRAAIADDLRRELRAEVARVRETQTARQEQYERALVTALGKLEARRVIDYTALRQDVETVATRAESELLNTRENLYHLAGYQPVVEESSRPRH